MEKVVRAYSECTSEIPSVHVPELVYSTAAEMAYVVVVVVTSRRSVASMGELQIFGTKESTLMVFLPWTITLLNE